MLYTFFLQTTHCKTDLFAAISATNTPVSDFFFILLSKDSVIKCYLFLESLSELF